MKPWTHVATCLTPVPPAGRTTLTGWPDPYGGLVSAHVSGATGRLGDCALTVGDEPSLKVKKEATMQSETASTTAFLGISLYPSSSKMLLCRPTFIHPCCRQNVYEIPTSGTALARSPPLFSLSNTFPVTTKRPKGFTFAPIDAFVTLYEPVVGTRFGSDGVGSD